MRLNDSEKANLQVFLGLDYKEKTTLEDFKELFRQACQLENIAQVLADNPKPQFQKSVIADTILFNMRANCVNQKLPFSYGEAYLAVGIPKEFLN